MDRSRKAICCLFLFAGSISNISCSQSTEPDHYPNTRYEDYYATWSEANGLIAYFHNRHFDDADDHDSTGIYIINPDGSDKYLLYEGHLIAGLNWSPDGQSLVVNFNMLLIRIAFPSGVADTLTATGEYWDPVWSPDGRYIAYSIRLGGYRGGIWIMNMDNGSTRRVVNYCDFANWPYLDSLLYLNLDRNYPIGAICISDTAGFFGRVVLPPQDGMDHGRPKPKMHASTRRVIFEAQLEGEPPSIWRVNPGDSWPIRAKQIRTFAMYPAFSPDGSQIVFADIHENNGKLWIINWDGTGLRQLTY